MTTPFEKTTSDESKRYADRVYDVGPEEPVRIEKEIDHGFVKKAFAVGRESAKGSLEIALRALVSCGTSHLECDDGWYSCPLAENYISESNQGLSGVCNCGAQATIEAIAEIKNRGDWCLPEEPR